MPDTSAWVSLASPVVGGVLALAGVLLAQGLTAWKESYTRERKHASDRAFIGSQLLVILAEYRDTCSSFANNPGEESVIQNPRPDAVEFKGVQGDWTVLSGELLLRILRLPLLQRQYERELEEVLDKLSEVEYLPNATLRFTMLANECDYLIDQLMSHCKLPSPWALDE